MNAAAVDDVKEFVGAGNGGNSTRDCTVILWPSFYSDSGKERADDASDTLCRAKCLEAALATN